MPVAPLMGSCSCTLSPVQTIVSRAIVSRDEKSGEGMEGLPLWARAVIKGKRKHKSADKLFMKSEFSFVQGIISCLQK